MPSSSALSLHPDLFADRPDDDEGLKFACWIDGLITAAVVGPKGVAPQELVSLVWDSLKDGQEAPDAESFRNELELTLTAIYGEILESLCGDPDGYAPKFMEVEDELTGARDWAEGFRYGMSLRPAAWNALVADREQRIHLESILLLLVDDRTLLDILRPPPPMRCPGVGELRRECAQVVPDAVAGLYRYWQARHSAPTGRNAPCPCGSGRKYKKCCLR